MVEQVAKRQRSSRSAAHKLSGEGGRDDAIDLVLPPRVRDYGTGHVPVTLEPNKATALGEIELQPL